MNKYEKETYNFDYAQSSFNNAKIRLRDCKNERNKSFREKYKTVFRLFDFGMILIIVFNLGALLITNAIVFKEVPDKMLLEANSIQADVNGYEKHPEGDSFMKGLFFQTILWTILFVIYLFEKYNAYEYYHLILLGIIVIFYLCLTSYDFVNNFGYLIGKILWGV